MNTSRVHVGRARMLVAGHESAIAPGMLAGMHGYSTQSISARRRTSLTVDSAWLRSKTRACSCSAQGASLHGGGMGTAFHTF